MNKLQDDPAQGHVQEHTRKSGFVALAGRPNVGKSTLLNALVDADVAITSSKPETTRRAIRGILTGKSHNIAQDYQIVFVDLPGIHRPRTLLGKRLNTIVDEQLTSVDIILFLTPANQKVGAGDLHILKHLQRITNSGGRIKLFAVVTKVDLVPKDKLLEHITYLQSFHQFDEVIPLSAKNDDNLEELVKVLVDNLSAGEFFYEESQINDDSWQNMVAELVREAALESLEQELPHSLMVQVDERVQDTIYVNLYVERDSQKGIILGKAGENIKKIRLQSQRRVREIMEPEIKLNLQVKVAKNWQQDTKLLARFGF